MPFTRILVVGVLLVASASLGLSAQEEGGHHSMDDMLVVDLDSWADFQTDSFVVMRVKVSDGKKEEDYKEKRIVLAHKKGLAEVLRIREKDGKYPPPKVADRDYLRKHVEAWFPKDLGLKEKGLKKETFALAGKKYPCVVEEYGWASSDGKQKKALTLWRCKGIRTPFREIMLPSGKRLALRPDVVRADFEQAIGEKKTTVQTRIETLRTPLQVGTGIVRLMCFVETVTTRESGDEGSTTTAKRWISEQIAGRLAKLESRVERKSGVTTREERILAFAGARRNAIIRTEKMAKDRVD